MLSLSYDLHIHSCLSPCGDNESTPANIVGMAYVKGLDVIALCDHNTSKNCPAAKEVADAYGITFISGMELTTEEEVHVVCLFPTVESALKFSDYVAEHIIPVENEPSIFGDQLIMDSDDNVIGTEKNLLINATDIDFLSAFTLVDSYGGVAIPAHIDKQANSLLSNLGFFPPESDFKTVELHDMEKLSALKKLHPYLEKCRAVTSSDAHYLTDINEPTNFLHAEENTAEAIISALKKQRI